MKYQVKFNSMEEVLEFVKIASKLPEDIDVVAGNITVDAKSVLGMLSCCKLDQHMQLRIHDEDADQAASSMKNFIVSPA